MEKKQGFFSAVARGLSPARSRSRSRSESPVRSSSALTGFFQRRWKGAHKQISGLLDPPVPRFGNLAPLMEGPDPGEVGDGGNPRRELELRSWLDRVTAASEPRLLLGVMGAPLAPVHVSYGEPLPYLSIKDTPIETSSAQYILQQYIAASGGLKFQSSIRNSYAMGKVKMIASDFETATKVMKNASKTTESGRFVLWKMAPEMWYVELAVGGSKFHAGCNGKLVWRHTPWHGAHAAKGPVRPLRRALQGLDPFTTASMFANAQCIGEKKVNGEDCFILKLSADPHTLKARSEGGAEIIRHFMFGYFSQRTGLLIHLEDSQLTRTQSITGGDALYWETTINSFLDDYRPVEGVMIAHSGRSVVTLFRFGEVPMSHTRNRMEEVWTIEEVAFNVPGLSLDCFIPPADIKSGSVSEICQLPQAEKGKSTMLGSHRAKVAAIEKTDGRITDNVLWRLEV
ncbi:uncharacterized protein A4U43_C07F30350 [Asparagus officinalis]|uniref:Uncharacterized protein n=1 Tax=Asparagus officinalis TaxID=4686 RepID=A0A5P1EG60_ASPOF|nr:uncharacterized protein LOC109849333 [Asparagus officinalis]ONK64824.1 uncharacterized protein A4U43_C07F30350 [Asparagus officinalis]